MTTLYHDGMTEEEYDIIQDIASNFFLAQNPRKEYLSELVNFCEKAVGPILKIVEINAIWEYAYEEDYNAFHKSAMDALKLIGKPALPILERYVLEDEVHEIVNVFAQKAIFEVLGLDSDERKKICKHIEAIPHEKDGTVFYTCNICEKILTEEEWME
jgi:hypothetical protein